MISGTYWCTCYSSEGGKPSWIKVSQFWRESFPITGVATLREKSSVMDAIGDLREEVSLMDVLRLWGETTNLTQGIYWQRYKGGGCFCWGSKQQGTDQKAGLYRISFWVGVHETVQFGMGLVGLLWLDLGSKVRDRWDFFFLGPGLRLGVKSGSRCSFLELFTLQRNWWVWGLRDRWGFVSFQSGSELGLMPSRLYHKSLLWDLYKSQPPSPSSNNLLAAMG